MSGLLLILLPTIVAPPQVTYAWQGGYVPERAKVVDVLAIVKPVGPIRTELRQESSGTKPGHNGTYAILRVECLDGYGIAKGEKVEMVVYAGQRGEPTDSTSAPSDGRHLLLVGLRPVQGKLFFPQGALFPDDDHLMVDRKQKDEIAALMGLQTNASKLNDGTDMRLRMAFSALDCLEGANDETYLRVGRFLSLARPWELGAGQNPSEARTLLTQFTQRLRKVAEEATPYRRSLIYGLLLRWRVPQAYVRYRDSLMALASSPTAYADANSQRELIWNMMDYASIDGPGWLDSRTWLDLVSTARNDVLRCYFLSVFGAPLDAKQMGQLALLLNSRGASVRYYTARRLALLTGERSQDPKLYGSDGHGHEIRYPDLDEKVAYWRARFQVPL